MIYDNTKQFKLDSSGKVIGVQLYIENVPNQQYIVSHLRLVDENEANGKTVATCKSTDRQDIYLAWPYRRGNITFPNYALPGNSNGVHIVTNGYNPPDYGYLAICLGKPSISQIVGGIGLPFNRHVSFEINFARLIDPVDPTPVDPSNLTNRIDRIERYLITMPTFKDFH